MLYFLRDAITGKWWNQQSYRHHGMWLLHTEYAPPFESEARASAHAKAIGMTMWRVQVVAVDANL